MGKCGNIFNIDKAGLQLHNRPWPVLVNKGVALSTSKKKENINTVTVGCNTEGKFLLPGCIKKGQRKKSEFQDRLSLNAVLVCLKKLLTLVRTYFSNGWKSSLCLKSQLAK